MIRITCIELEDFKNVAYGKVVLSSWEPGLPIDSDVIGIYGQNGSGKTAVVEALGIIKKVIASNPLDRGDAECIADDSHSATITLHGVCFGKDGLAFCSFVYSITLCSKAKGGHDIDEGDVYIAEERLSVKDYRAEKPRLKTLFDCKSTLDGSSTLMPESRWKLLFALDGRMKSRLQLALRAVTDNCVSPLFSRAFCEVVEDMRRIAGKSVEDLSIETRAAVMEVLEPLDLLMSELAAFASNRLAIVGMLGQEFEMASKLLVPSRWGEGNGVVDPSLTLDFSKPMLLKRDALGRLKTTISSINPVLSSLIPGFSLVVKALDSACMDNTTEGVTVEIVCSNGMVTIPLRRESAGVKRLVSILALLVDVYNNPGTCLIVDDLDSGIDEFLFGEILRVIQERGRGQLIFTAHNLRSLEVLGGKSIAFTATNPHNRYTKFRGARENTNLRNGYLRAIVSGGQPEELYSLLSKDDIEAALDGAASRLKFVR